MTEFLKVLLNIRSLRAALRELSFEQLQEANEKFSSIYNERVAEIEKTRAADAERLAKLAEFQAMLADAGIDPRVVVDLLSVQADEYVSTWRDLGAATGFTPVVLAQCAGGSDRLDGWRQCGAGGCYRLYWSGDPTYSPAVWFNRSSRITSRLRAGRGERIAAGRYCSAPGISCRRAAYWRGHRNVGCAGVYLVIVKSRTLAAKRRSMIKS